MDEISPEESKRLKKEQIQQEVNELFPSYERLFSLTRGEIIK